MNTEQCRPDFEYWYDIEFSNLHGPLVRFDDSYENTDHALMWEAYQAGRAALQSQKPKANDLMLSAVIRMPFEMAMADPISRMQFYQRAQQALNDLEALQSQGRESAFWKCCESQRKIGNCPGLESGFLMEATYAKTVF